MIRIEERDKRRSEGLLVKQEMMVADARMEVSVEQLPLAFPMCPADRVSWRSGH